MAKKLEELADESSEEQLAKTIMESANQIWLAGLGAFSKGQEEGAKMFEALVKEGEHLQKRARKRRAMVWSRSPPEPARAGTSLSRFSKDGSRARWLH
jgi:poly(hydroxyalkanoate) granule-associated protein